ncbi:hypothetical protein FRC02_007546 [Tulasnella sp. 418]|nr:hypothetical protein FRC02_007546 [Tulasnella sp. 418]
MNVHETPSRILRRIKENEAKAQDLPSLPSITFEEDETEDSFNRSISEVHINSDLKQSTDQWNQSTPMAYPNGRPAPRVSATPGRVRFANAVMTRSADTTEEDQEVDDQSPEVSKISGAQFDNEDEDEDMEIEASRDGAQDLVASDEEGLSIMDALKPISPSNSPGHQQKSSETSYQEFEVSIKSAPRASPFDPSKWGSNISRRKPSGTRQRVPSLSHSQSSESSSSSNATPSVHSLPLTTPSRPVHEGEEVEEEDHSRSSRRTSSPRASSVREDAQHQTPRPQASDRSSSFTQSSLTSSNSVQEHMIQNRPSPVARAFSSPAPIPSPAQTITQGPLSLQTPASKRAFALVTSSARPKMKTPIPHPKPIRGARFSLPGFLAAELSAQGNGPDGSYISTASSHDLTIHPRANASFDHIADAYGRLDRVKVNRHVHRLNQMLGEENTQLMNNQEHLMAEVERLNHEKEELLSLVSMLKDGVERKEARIDKLEEGISQDGREVLSELDKVKKELSDLRDAFEEYRTDAENAFDEYDKKLAEKDEKLAEAREELEAEEKSKARLKEKYQASQDAIQKGTTNLVMEIEEKQNKSIAEAARLQSELAAKVAEAEALRVRLEASGVEEENIRLAEERAELFRREKEAFAARVAVLERELEVVSSKKGKEIERLEETVADLEGRIDEQKSIRASVQKKADEKQKELDELREVIERTSSELVLQSDKLREVLNRCETLQAEVHASKLEVQRAETRVKKMESALQRAEERVEEWQIEKREMESRERVLRREKDDVERLLAQAQHHSMGLEKSMGGDDEDKMPINEHEKVVSKLEAELDKAYKQIGRLEGDLKGGYEIRKVVMEGRETELVALRKERQELRELVQSLKDALIAGEGVNQSIRSVMENEATPGRKTRGGYSTTPARLRQSIKFRTPKTPGIGLKEPSILNQTTISMSGISPILSQLEKMQNELVQAYDKVDDKMDKLQQAGRETMKLKVTVSDLEGKLTSLESEVEILKGKEDRLKERLTRWRCRTCGERGDVSRYLGASVSSAASSDGNRSVIRHLNEEHEKLKLAKQALEAQKADLAIQLKKMNLEIQDVKDDGERQVKYLQAELDRAQGTARELENQLNSERSKMKKLSHDQAKSEKGTAEVKEKFEQTELMFEEVRAQLKSAKQREQELENELKTNSDKEQKVKALEQKVQKNRDTILRLRSERDVLSSDCSALKKQFDKMSKELDSTRQKFSSARVAHASTQDKLQLQVNEVDELRKSINRRSRHRQSSKAMATASQEPNRELASAIADAQAIITSLESDLQHVRMEAEKFGRDLIELRAEEETRKREFSEIQTQNMMLKDHLDEVRREKHKIEDYAANHICPIPQGSEEIVQALQLRHKAESKGLIAQCRYLKGRITRESRSRGALVYQKDYLLQIISVLEEGEQRILAAIARIGFPKPEARPRRITLKAVATAVVFLIRTKRASDAWREQSAIKEEIVSALHQVRQRRQIR